jgi:tetratricopeptide (TPR) repeat protein
VAPRLATLDMADLEGHAWASVLAASALQSDSSGTDPRIDALLISAEDDFWREGDEQGLGYVAYVRGTRAVGRGNFVDAAAWWRQAREYLGDDGGPVSEIALAHLALAEYHHGHLQDALVTAEQALALARRRRNRRGEGLSLLYLAFFSLWSGEFARAETRLTTSRRVYGEIPDPLDRCDAPLVEASLAALQAVRRHRTSAEAMFESALQMSESAGTDWYTAIIRTLRAELCAPWNPARSIADANLAVDFLADVMRDDWWCRWARRALAVADMHAGNLETARQSLTELLHEQMNSVERVWTFLYFADCRRRAGAAPDALDALHKALHLSDESGAKYLQARTFCLLSEVDVERSQEWRGRALEVMDSDPAYRVLLTSSTPLRIDAFGRGRILVGDRRVKFPTRHAEAAVFILALSGYNGVNAESLAERLWPNVASSVWPGRVRTLLWQIRRALVDEAWRLQRDGAVIRLDLAGAIFDVDEARHLARTVLQGISVPAQDHAQLVTSLRQPLVTAYQYEDWLSEFTNELHTLEARLAPPPGLRG